MQTVAGVQAQFERLQQLAFDATGNGITAPYILFPFFERMNNEVTWKALCEIEEVSENNAFIFLEFLNYIDRKQIQATPDLVQGCQNIKAKLNAMRYKATPSIIDDCNWTFIWRKTSVMGRYNDALVITCFPRPTNKIEEKYHAPTTLLIYLYDDVRSYGWSLVYNSKVMCEGKAESFDDAAEHAYHAFFERLSERKFRSAMIPEEDKTVTILGNWISMDQVHKNYQTISLDDRRAEVFVIGWPEMSKESVELKITRLTRIGRADNQSINPMDYNVWCDKLLLSGNLDWCITKPEQYVKGDCYCKKCKQVQSVQTMDMRYVRSYGPLCGPCRDHYQGDCDVNIDALLVG